MQIAHYFDYKSPYAYLAQQGTFDLARELGVEIEWRPYELDIPAYLGAAELDRDGRDLIGTRSPHQWRRVRYAYMDCRREAARRGLVILGPRRIFDSSTAHIGMLYARERGDFERYHERVFERFFRRELDLEDAAAIRGVLEETGVESGGFPDFLAGEGRDEYRRIVVDAEAAGVFGVPSWLVDGELYWGNERLAHVRERIAAGLKRGRSPAR